MKLLYIVILGICSLLLSTQAWSATITAVANGNWTNNAVWSCNCQPGNNDDIEIPAGRTVTINSAILLLLGPVITITVGGTLTLNNGTLSIDSSDVVNILSGGKVNGTGLFGGSVLSGLTPIGVSSGSQIDGPKTISNGTLPIKLIYFKGTTVSDGISLTWASAEEINFDYYDVAHSSDGKSFITIATVQGKDANGAEYNFIDTSPETTNYYKLTAVDIDGSREEMPLIKEEWKGRTDWLSIYPNPVNDGIIHARFFGGASGSLRLLDCNGFMIAESLIVNEFSSDIHLPAATPPGAYFVSAQMDGRTTQVKVIVR